MSCVYTAVGEHFLRYAVGESEALLGVNAAVVQYAHFPEAALIFSSMLAAGYGRMKRTPRTMAL